MRRFMQIVLVLLAAAAIGAPVALAGSPHFVGAPTATRTDNTLTVSGKEAGLGDEEEINIVVTATAECINKGEKHPKATNKESLSKEEPVTVQNGKAIFSTTLTASFGPSCSPPMSVVFSSVKVEDTTNGISATLTGTF